MDILKRAEEYLEYMTEARRELHKNPGVGFDNRDTMEYLSKRLTELGITPVKCGKCGLYALIGQGAPCVLLRADTDGLEISEETSLEFCSKNGRMHACGHDMHAAMLLGCARILKEREDTLSGTVKIMLQSAEETLEGAKDMMDAGVLENPNVSSAMMLHVLTALPIESGTLIVSSGGASAPCADFFEITVSGKGCHGSSPFEGVDPIYAASSIVTSLSEIVARELPCSDAATLTIGSFKSGDCANVIPDTALLKGTLRCFDENIRSLVKSRICEISEAVARGFRASADLKLTSGCPTLYNDEGVSRTVFDSLSKAIGAGKVLLSKDIQSRNGSVKTGGSEDFAYISHAVPSVMIALCAGNSEDGYKYPLHHPKAEFDESALKHGCAAYCIGAVSLIEKYNKGEI